MRFNPGDPNVYARFMDAMDSIRTVEEKLVAKAKELEQTEDQQVSGAAVLRLMRESDREIKNILSEVFGEGKHCFPKLAILRIQLPMELENILMLSKQLGQRSVHSLQCSQS